MNDLYGHLTGDQVLCEITKCISTAIRDHDVVGRSGGEEFLILLPNTDVDGAQLLGERVCNRN